MLNKEQVMNAVIDILRREFNPEERETFFRIKGKSDSSTPFHYDFTKDKDVKFVLNRETNKLLLHYMVIGIWEEVAIEYDVPKSFFVEGADLTTEIRMVIEEHARQRQVDVIRVIRKKIVEEKLRLKESQDKLLELQSQLSTLEHKLSF